MLLHVKFLNFPQLFKEIWLPKVAKCWFLAAPFKAKKWTNLKFKGQLEIQSLFTLKFNMFWTELLKHWWTEWLDILRASSEMFNSKIHGRKMARKIQTPNVSWHLRRLNFLQITNSVDFWHKYHYTPSLVYGSLV